MIGRYLLKMKKITSDLLTYSTIIGSNGKKWAHPHLWLFVFISYCVFGQLDYQLLELQVQW